jgi:hypothetical protein
MVGWFMDDELEKMKKAYVSISTQYFLEEKYEILPSGRSV